MADPLAVSPSVYPESPWHVRSQTLLGFSGNPISLHRLLKLRKILIIVLELMKMGLGDLLCYDRVIGVLHLNLRSDGKIFRVIHRIRVSAMLQPELRASGFPETR